LDSLDFEQHFSLRRFLQQPPPLALGEAPPLPALEDPAGFG